MKDNIIKNTIITQAISLGFDFKIYDKHANSEVTLEWLNNDLWDFFHENRDLLPEIEDECEEEISVIGTRKFHYGDVCNLQDCVDFSQFRDKPPGTKISLGSTVIEDPKDNLMKYVDIYALTEGDDEDNDTNE